MSQAKNGVVSYNQKSKRVVGKLSCLSMVFVFGEGMQQQNEVSQESASKQFAYDRLKEPRTLRPVSFQHSDNSKCRAFIFEPPDGPAYFALSVVLVKSQSENTSVEDRRKSMLNNRHKPTIPAGTWAQPKQKSNNAGWKFHLSIAQEGDNVKNAWDALVPILLKHKVGETKIVKPGIAQDANKVITVYTFNGGPKLHEWESFLKDVELAFREHEIASGDQIFEHHVKGSDYIYYRNDGGKSGEYVPDEYNFMYKVVDKIPPTEEERLKFADQLKQNENAVGYIVKSKDSDICLLQLKTDSSWLPMEFNVSQLKDVKELGQDKLITISPVTNRAAYLELVVPKLNKGIPSTDNISGAEDPFVNVDLTPSMDKGTSRKMY
jgi:hypothetical protein